MKSLEIVNEIIKDFEERLEFEKEFLKANHSEKHHNKFVRQLEGAKQIKQDLEVLEIIRKKVDFRFMGTCLQVSGENNTKWTFIKEFNLSKEKEEYSKFKKWLETNKEGDYND